MRWLWIINLVLIGCTAPTPSPPIPSQFTLDRSGVQVAAAPPLRIDFGRAEPGAIDAMSRLLGHDPVEVVTQTECGAGPVHAARWQSGLTMIFQDGDFRGWSADAPGLRVAGGLHVGMVPPALPMQTTSLGTEFEQSGIFGLVQNADEVSILWAGVTCFFR